jgi:hypothetical protein
LFRVTAFTPFMAQFCKTRAVAFGANPWFMATLLPTQYETGYPIMANAERAIEKLYEDAAVRDSLADPEADTLLRWGEDQIMRLADEAPDDATFEAQVDHIRRLLKDTNRFVGERGQMDAETRVARLNALMTEGEALGAPPAAQASALADSFASGDDATTLQALLGLLTPAQASAAAPPQTPAPAFPPNTALMAPADAHNPPPPAPEPEPTDTAPEPTTSDPAPAAEPEPQAAPSILKAFQKWLTPTPAQPDPRPAPQDMSPRPEPDNPSRDATTATPDTPHPTDDDTTGDAFLHGETQDDWLE